MGFFDNPSRLFSGEGLKLLQQLTKESQGERIESRGMLVINRIAVHLFVQRQDSIRGGCAQAVELRHD